MTSPRYRCCFCGTYANNVALNMRDHMVRRHRMALEALLRPLQVFREVYDPEEI